MSRDDEVPARDDRLGPRDDRLAPRDDRLAPRDDRLLPLTRWLLVLLGVLTTIFGLILFVLPDRTDSAFAWTIAPPMSAVFIGSGYLFAAVTFWQLLWRERWHPMGIVLPVTWVFAGTMLVATLLHLERFHQGTLTFDGWFIAYLVVLILAPIAYVQNRVRDPGPRPTDVLVPARARLVLVAAGGIYGLLGLILFVTPTALAAAWPWPLTPLVSRVIGGWLLVFGVGAAAAWLEPRWTAQRPLVQGGVIWLSLLLIGSLLRMGDFEFARPLAGLWFIALIVGIVATLGYYVFNARLAASRDATQRSA